MKELLRKKSFKILVVLVGILVILAIVTSLAGGFLLPNLLGSISTPMQKVSTVMTNNAGDTAKNLTRSYEDLLAENEALKQQISELNDKLVDYYSVKQENDQLRNFLELKKENQDFKMVTGSVVGRDPNSLFYSFRVDKGSLAGISVNDPVITEDGLVGWVSEVSSMYCNVTTIYSPDTSFSAVDKVSRDNGIITSEITLLDQGLIKMGLLEKNNKILAGDIIVTSGIGGVFPKNLKVGKAVEVKNSENDVSYYATIKPFVDIKSVRDVLIITEFEGQGEALTDFSDPASQPPASSASSAASGASSGMGSSQANSAASSAASGVTR